MIVDKLENLKLYSAISPRLARAFESLRDQTVAHRENGRYEIEGEDIFALVQRYTTRTPEQSHLESHRKYIDVQYVVSGSEVILHGDIASLDVHTPYDGERDAAFYHRNPKLSSVRLSAGTAAVFFPQDAHMPCLQADGPEPVHKIVYKVRVD